MMIEMQLFNYHCIEPDRLARRYWEYSDVACCDATIDPNKESAGMRLRYVIVLDA